MFLNIAQLNLIVLGLNSVHTLFYAVNNPLEKILNSVHLRLKRNFESEPSKLDWIDVIWLLLFSCLYGALQLCWVFSLWLIQAKLVAAREKFGRDIRVFETSIASQTQNGASNSGRNHLTFRSIIWNFYYCQLTIGIWTR